MNSTQTQKNRTAAKDAIDLLVADHQNVRGLFDQFETMKDDASKEEKGALVGKICDELTAHESIENEVFFPAVREVLRNKDVLEEATVEQEDAGQVIQALAELSPGEVGYEEKVTGFGRQIAAHAAEEERDVFPKVQRSDIDISKLGAEMSARKTELQQNHNES